MSKTFFLHINFSSASTSTSHFTFILIIIFLLFFHRISVQLTLHEDNIKQLIMLLLIETDQVVLIPDKLIQIMSLFFFAGLVQHLD
jgi:hypothetical protein